MADLFESKAPGIMRDLMKDFAIGVGDAAAIVGNLGHECNGFRTMQEVKPLVPGSRGGYGWAQWTASRRREFEAYCARNNFDPSSDRANYGFLFVELRGPERRAIPATKAAGTLKGKVEAFEQSFLRAGIKHYPSRIAYAQRALAAYQRSNAARTGTVVGGAIATGGAAVAVEAGVDPAAIVGALVFASAAAGLFLFIRSRRNARQD